MPLTTSRYVEPVCSADNDNAHSGQANNGPMRLDDLAIRTQTPLDADKVLFEKFRAHERVEFDPRTNLYSFKVRPHTGPNTPSGLDLHLSMTTTFVAKRPCSPKFNVQRVVVAASRCARLRSRGRMHLRQSKSSRRRAKCSSP